jgi:hypothetical protein
MIWIFAALGLATLIFGLFVMLKMWQAFAAWDDDGLKTAFLLALLFIVAAALWLMCAVSAGLWP